MSELKATPGPWELKAPNILSLDRSVKPDGRRRIASLVVAYKGSEEYYANANLIAAAPEMYEALGVCLAMAERALKSSMNLNGESPYDIGMDALRKARGEQS